MVKKVKKVRKVRKPSRSTKVAVPSVPKGSPYLVRVDWDDTRQDAQGFFKQQTRNGRIIRYEGKGDKPGKRMKDFDPDAKRFYVWAPSTKWDKLLEDANE